MFSSGGKRENYLKEAKDKQRMALFQFFWKIEATTGDISSVCWRIQNTLRSPCLCQSGIELNIVRASLLWFASPHEVQSASMRASRFGFLRGAPYFVELIACNAFAFWVATACALLLHFPIAQFASNEIVNVVLNAF
jgi:hypothetical protein